MSTSAAAFSSYHTGVCIVDQELEQAFFFFFFLLFQDLKSWQNIYSVVQPPFRVFLRSWTRGSFLSFDSRCKSIRQLEVTCSQSVARASEGENAKYLV